MIFKKRFTINPKSLKNKIFNNFMSISIYSKAECNNCDLLKKSLNQSGIKYNEIKLKSLYDLSKILQNVEKFEEENLKGFPVVVENHKMYTFEEAMNKYSEEILKPNDNSYTFYPITYPPVYEMYKQARASFWQPEEISLLKDSADFEKLNSDEKHFITHILAFFAASDGIVNENLNTNFEQEVNVPEIKAFYTFQSAIESIHSETYSILLDKFVSDKKEKVKLQNAILNVPAITKKAVWSFKYMNSDIQFAKRLLAFSCVEGIYFSGSFCAIFWLKKRNLLPGLTFSNELISRDEGLHTEFAVLLYNLLKYKLNEKEVFEIVNEAVLNEKEFIIEALPCKLIGMNSELMAQYIEFVADRLLQSLGYNKYYFTSNPFDFMENISLEGKTNFFEKRVGEYAKANVMNDEENQNIFELDEDF